MKRILPFCLFIWLFSLELVAQSYWNPLILDEKLRNFVLLDGTADFEFHNGVLTGISKMNTRNSFLATKEHYADFILEFEVKADTFLNSGVQIRSNQSEDYKNQFVHGYQVEIESSDRRWAGGIYDENRRGWLYNLEEKEEAQNAFKKAQWNHYRIEAIADTIRTWVNEIPCANLVDGLTKKGFIAFQVHDIGNNPHLSGRKIEWRNVAILTENLEEERWEWIEEEKED